MVQKLCPQEAVGSGGGGGGRAAGARKGRCRSQAGCEPKQQGAGVPLGVRLVAPIAPGMEGSLTAWGGRRMDLHLWLQAPVVGIVVQCQAQ